MSPVEIVFLSTSVLTLATGLIIVALNPWRLINRSYLVAATLSAAWLLCVFVAVHIGQSEPYEGKPQDMLLWLRIGNAVAAFLPCSFFLIKAAVIGTYPITGMRNRVWPWVVVSCLLAIVAFSESFIPSHSTAEAQVRGVGYPVYMGSFSALCILITYEAAKEIRTYRGVRRLEIKFFVINFCLGTLATLLTFFLGTALTTPVLRYAGPFVVVAYFGLTIWAICYHRIFDSRQVFATLGRHLSTLVVLSGCILIIDSNLNDVLPEPFALTISSCCGGLLAVYWDRKACRWLNLDAKQLLASPRAQIIEWAREEVDAGRLVTRFETFLRDWCQAESVTLHTLESRESPTLILNTTEYANTFPLLRETGYITAETLARRRPDTEILLSKEVMTKRNLSALIAVPRGSHSPSCVVAFGHKHSLRPYTYPDIQLLIELIELMDNILSQAQVATRTAQIEKMETAAMMSRGLAHDLNNLATPVSSFLLHMESRVIAGTAEAEVLDHAKHSIKVMQDYIRESLFFARRHVLQYESAVSTEILSTVTKLTKDRAAMHGVTVSILGKEPLPFSADRTLTLRLLQNLVLNAIDATPHGGVVTLSAGMAGSGRIAFSVTDQGRGVPVELMDRIFEPYFTTKDTGSVIRGLGLGLAISLKISGLHGGELRVGKAPCGGAVFTFTLPANPALLISRPENPIHHDHPNDHNNQPEAELHDEPPHQRFDASVNSHR